MITEISETMVKKPIETDEEHQAAMERIDEIFHAPKGTPEGDELEQWVHLVEVYEAETFPLH